MRRWTAAAVLSAVFMLSVFMKVRHSTQTPRYDSQDGTGYFRSESAFQYRYARMLASGQAIPELDRDAQYPEGVRPRAELTLLMERATAWTWLALPVKPSGGFHRFVIIWVAVVSSLCIPAAYLLATRLTGSKTAAAAAASVYGLSWASISPVIGTYGFQSLALPLIYWSLAFAACALDQKQRRPWLCSAAAGLTLAAALAGWHFTRFYLATFLAAAAYAAWRAHADRFESARLRQVLTAMLACAAMAGVLSMSLRESRFLLSPAMLFGYALVGALHFPRRSRLNAAAGAAALAALTLDIPDGAAYAHVYGLLFEKLRHGLIKPSDPSGLGGEARLLWTGAFDSPGLSLAVFSLLPLAFILLPRLAAREKAAEAEPASGAGRILDALAFCYGLGTLLVARLLPFFAFFLALCSLRRFKSRPWTALLIVLALLEGAKSWAPASRYNVFMRLSAPYAGLAAQPAASSVNERQVLDWLKEKAAGVPALAHYGLSASLLAYAGTPVILHPKFESAAIRAKTLAFLSALYSDEETLYRFCERTGAGLVVYSTDSLLDISGDGPRYASGSMRLTANSPAVLFHFKPQALKRFRLLFQNQDFRVFAPGEGPPGGPKPPYEPVYDLNLYRPQTLADGSLKLDVENVNERINLSRKQLFVARLLARMGQTRRALSSYEASFSLWPPEPRTLEEARRLAESVK